MIKFGSENKEGKKLLGLGVSEGNVQLLKKGKPILVKSEALKQLTGWDGEIMLFYGETEEKMREMLKEFIGDSTIVRDEL